MGSYDELGIVILIPQLEMGLKMKKDDIKQWKRVPGTFLKPDQAALVFSEEGWKLLMPEYEDDDEVPEFVILMAAISMKLEDRSWVERILEDFREYDNTSNNDEAEDEYDLTNRPVGGNA